MTAIKRVRNFSQYTDKSFNFTPLEVKVLGLVFNYCYYYLNNAKSRLEEFEDFTEPDYYLYLKSLIKTGQKIRVKNVKLSSLILNDDTKMSQLVQALEDR